MSAPSAPTTALPPPAESRAGEAAPSPLLTISNETVQLYKRAFGRGPTKVRTLFADPGTVVIVLEDALTAGEPTLLDVGADEQLREFRQVIQEALEPAMRSLIERDTRAPNAGVHTRNRPPPGDRGARDHARARGTERLAGRFSEP